MTEEFKPFPENLTFDKFVGLQFPNCEISCDKMLSDWYTESSSKPHMHYKWRSVKVSKFNEDSHLLIVSQIATDCSGFCGIVHFLHYDKKVRNLSEFINLQPASFCDDAQIRSEIELRGIAPPGCTLITTEKPDGDIFIFTVLVATEKGFVIAMGPKDDPYVFWTAGKPEAKICVQHYFSGIDLVTHGSFRNEHWCQKYPWAEMCWYFLNKIKSIEGKEFLEWIWDEKLTCTGYFESHKRQRLVDFETDHRMVKFFLCTKNTDESIDAEQNFQNLERLQKYGLNTVWWKHVDSTKDSLVTIRHQWMPIEWLEGANVFVIQEGKVKSIVPLYTIWYVVHKSIRDGYLHELQKFTRPYVGPKDIEGINVWDGIAAKLKSFDLDPNAPYYMYYAKWVELFRGDIHVRVNHGQSRNQIINLLNFEYPEFIRNIERKYSRELRKVGLATQRTPESS